MPVLNMSYAVLKDPDAFQDYVQKASVLMQDYEVEVVVRGKFIEAMRGDPKGPHIAAVFRYTDRESVERFYSSEAYRQLIPLRDAACDMEIQLYEE